MLNPNFRLEGVVNVAGWGIKNYKTRETPDELLYVQLQIVNNRECDRRKPTSPKTQICIGQGDGKDSCGGDSGLYT